MKKIAALIVAATAAVSANAAITVSPLTTFGGDGWLSPAEYARLGAGTARTARGLAYNPVTKNLVLASRTTGLTGVAVLNSTTGAESHVLDITGVTGGTFNINMVGAGEDGAIYLANLATTSGTSPNFVTQPFKVYRWASDAPAVAPTLAFGATTL